jgi:bifunctional non-homologous end joining protein LigD
MAGVKQQVEVEGRSLSLSNLDKALYPGNGFTKAQVIDYYIRIAPWMLAHYAKRPVTMKRFPDGVRGKAFYEKDAPKHTPDWVHTTDVLRQKGGKPIRYVCVDDLPTLVWCANIASLELHPFLHRAGQLDCPASMVFDLDPGEGADLVTCATVAFYLRELLDANGLQCLPKVSGSKGLQLYVPLNTKISYALTRAFAQGAAQLLEKRHPKLIVSEMAKNLRHGKVFIDWSQNSDFKTTIGVYSLRANNDEPFVSSPVSWDELALVKERGDAASLRFAPDAAVKRAASAGDLFAPLLAFKQTLPKSLSESDAAAKPPAAKAHGKRVQARTAEGEDDMLSSLPKAVAAFIPPMLLLRTERLPEGSAWRYELKLDGYRAVAAKSAGRVRLWSRNENDFGQKYPAIAAALAQLPDDTVVDGEIVALDPEGRPSFNALQNYGSDQTPLIYYLFDAMVLNGRDLRGETLEARRKLLEEKVLPLMAEPIRASPVLPGNLDELIGAVKEQGLEGLVGKRRDSRYEAGERSGAWAKMRVNEGQEFVIGGYTVGGREFDALVFGYYEGDELIYVARTRNGFTPAARDQLMKKFRGLEITKCPFANLPEARSGRWGQGLTATKMNDCRWLKPVLVGQFEFREWTPDNHLRHSRFVALRDDKKAREVRREVENQ